MNLHPKMTTVVPTGAFAVGCIAAGGIGPAVAGRRRLHGLPAAQVTSPEMFRVTCA